MSINRGRSSTRFAGTVSVLPLERHVTELPLLLMTPSPPLILPRVTRLLPCPRLSARGIQTASWYSGPPGAPDGGRWIHEKYCGPLSCLIGILVCPCIIFCPFDERKVNSSWGPIPVMAPGPCLSRRRVVRTLVQGQVWGTNE